MTRIHLTKDEIAIVEYKKIHRMGHKRTGVSNVETAGPSHRDGHRDCRTLRTRMPDFRVEFASHGPSLTESDRDSPSPSPGPPGPPPAALAAGTMWQAAAACQWHGPGVRILKLKSAGAAGPVPRPFPSHGLEH
jgi:hypothetical protein